MLAQPVKNLPVMQETQKMWVQSLAQEDTMKKEMVPHSSILAWKKSQTEEYDGLQYKGSQRVGYDWATKHTHG